jgi:hypothetical protein
MNIQFMQNLHTLLKYLLFYLIDYGSNLGITKRYRRNYYVST